MSSQLYIITAKTHLHAGSGSTNAGVIDNLVQRDPAGKLPCIYSSSLKGAFREYFEEVIEKTSHDEKPLSDSVFGAGTNKRKQNDINARGSHIFYQASLLSIPVRSNHKPFYNATSPVVLQNFLDEYKLFTDTEYPEKAAIEKLIATGAVKDKPVVYHTQVEHLRIEDFDISSFGPELSPSIKKLFGDNIVVMNVEDFNYQCGDLCLPIIARNNLENGESKNLWYEQIVPRQARFWFYTVCFQPSDIFDGKVNGKNVQIGANASIGYGLCTINNLSTQLS